MPFTQKAPHAAVLLLVQFAAGLPGQQNGTKGLPMS